MPRFVPGSNAAYSTQLGISVVGETPNQTASMPTLGQIDISLGRLRSIVRVSRDLFTDAPYLLEALRDAFTADLGAQVNNLILNGAVSSGFEGVLTNTAIASTNLQTGALHTFDATTDAQWRTIKANLPEQFRATGRVFVHGTTQAGLENEQPGSNNRPIAVRHDDVSGSWLLDEIPLTSSQFMPSYPTTATGPILLYGSLQNGYVVGQRADIRASVLSETDAADWDSVDVVMLLRLGGCVQDARAFQLGVI
jgi:HK97 family phage major capsid protein